MFAEMRERLELARDAWAEAREEGQGPVSAGLAALRAAAGRQARELDPDEIKERLARIAGRDLAADAPVHEAGTGKGGRDIRERLAGVLGRDKADEQDAARKREREMELERQNQIERERDLGYDWEL